MLSTIRVLFCVILATSLSISLCVAADEAAAKPVRVLVVTGVDYAGHPWRSLAQEFRKALEVSPDIELRIVEDVEVLGTDLLFDYDVVFLNFKNYYPLRREDVARRNLLRYVRDGGGLVLFHFTCGAFQNWPEYATIAGRVWNPQMRAHDPFGEFTVRIVGKEHPTMRGVADFRITDELYTCLDGTRDIEVLAEATSSVDAKTYPMAFVFTEGKGRVFHTALGHNEQAFAAPALSTMLRNAVFWCGKRDDAIEAVTEIP